MKKLLFLFLVVCSVQAVVTDQEKKDIKEALLSCDAEKVKKLINANNELKDAVFGNGDTLLHSFVRERLNDINTHPHPYVGESIKECYKEILEFLIDKKGLSLDIKNNDNLTPYELYRDLKKNMDIARSMLISRMFKLWLNGNNELQIEIMHTEEEIDWEKVKSMVESDKYDLNHKNFEGETVLDQIIENKKKASLPVVKYFFEKGANLKPEYLITAILNDNVPLAKYLFDKGYRPKKNELEHYKNNFFDASIDMLRLILQYDRSILSKEWVELLYKQLQLSKEFLSIMSEPAKKDQLKIIDKMINMIGEFVKAGVDVSSIRDEASKDKKIDWSDLLNEIDAATKARSLHLSESINKLAQALGSVDFSE